MTAPLRVLFVSTKNSARSQIAEALLGWLAKDRAIVTSAGTEPSSQIHPLADEALRRIIGGTLRGRKPKPVAAVAPERFDYVFTLDEGVREISSRFPGALSQHWPHDDPGKVGGSLDARQRAFDRFAAALLKQMRSWWKANAPKQPVEKPFVARLVVRGFARAIEPGPARRGRLYHVHHKPLYEAIGHPDKEQLLKLVRASGVTNRRGRPLTSQAIGVLLRNQLYAGIVDVTEYGVRAKCGACQPLISEDVASRMPRRSRSSGTARTLRRDAHRRTQR